MDRRARIALEEARKWADEGIIEADALPRLQARYASAPKDVNWAADSFYAVGGVLLGAAVIAIGTFMELREDESMQAFLLASASVLFLLGLVIRSTKAEQGLVDAAFIASLIPAVASSMMFQGIWALQWLAAPYGLALVVWRRDRAIMATAASIAALIAIPVAIFATFEEFTHEVNEDNPITVWWAFASLALVVAMVAPRFDKRLEEHGPHGVAAISYIIASIAFTAAVLEPDFTGGTEVVLAVFFGLALGAGLWLRAPPVVVASILAITVDAIVFAFDVGGFALGVTSLIVLSLAMVAAAVWMQKRGVRLPGARE